MLKGVDIKNIKDLLGHFDIKTTACYLHVKREQLVNIESPLDELMSKDEI
jgi:integrase/recombinase XerD